MDYKKMYEELVGNILKDDEVLKRLFWIGTVFDEKVLSKALPGMSECVMARLAENGYLSDELSDSDNVKIRKALASANPEMYLDDPSEEVRKECARHKEFAHLFLNDSNDKVRRVAVTKCKEEYITKDMLKDKSIEVRDAIADRKLFLKELANDRSKQVRTTVAEVVDKSDTDVINILVTDKNEDVRWMLAKRCLCADILYNDESLYVREKVAGYCDELIARKMMANATDNIKRAFVFRKFFLDEFVKDEDASIRKIIAIRGDYLDILVNDSDSGVRAGVARHSKYHNVLSDDESESVRIEVALYSNDLEILSKLAKDDSRRVRIHAKRVLSNLQSSRYAV